MSRIGIVGCGMAGAASAYLLARDGHHVTVLERAPVLGPVGAGILLQQSGQAVLRHLGVLDSVLAHAAPLNELYARHVSGEALIRTRFADYAPGAFSYGVHRGVLFNALLGLVRTQPIEVRTGCEITSREDGTSGVWLRDAAGFRHGPFDWVLGADGSRSRLRELCGFPTSITEYTHGTLWVTAPADGIALTASHEVKDEPPQYGRLLQVVERNRKLLGLLPLGDGLVSLYWGLPVRDFPRVRAAGLGPLKREMLAFAPECGPVVESLRDFQDLLFTSYRHVHVRRRNDDRVLLIGDAAHAMSPHLGQGVNLALVDAWRLAEAVRSTPTPAAAFRRFVRRQRAYIGYYATITYLLSPFFQSGWAILGWGRDWALPLLPRIPWVRRQMLMTVCGLKGGYFREEEEL